MGRRFVDLSIAIENDVASDPPGLEPSVQYLHHGETHEQLMQFFPGLEKSDLPDEESWAWMAKDTFSLHTRRFRCSWRQKERADTPTSTTRKAIS